MATQYMRLSERTNAVRKDSAIHKVMATIKKLGPINCTAIAAHTGAGVSVVHKHIYTLHKSIPRMIYISRWVIINKHTMQAEFSVGARPDVPKPPGIQAAARMAETGDPTVRIAGDAHLTCGKHKQARKRAIPKVVTKKGGYCKYNGSILTRFVAGINPWTGVKSSTAT